MRTEQEILNEIKRSIQIYWDSSYDYDTDKRQFARVQAKVDALLWVVYGYSHREVCPYCGEIMECDTVDVGVGCQQCGPYYCMNCHASEIHPSDTLELDDDEKLTGYYKSRISPIANTCCGTPVSHEVAKKLYEVGALDNCKPN